MIALATRPVLSSGVLFVQLPNNVSESLVEYAQQQGQSREEAARDLLAAALQEQPALPESQPSATTPFCLVVPHETLVNIAAYAEQTGRPRREIAGLLLYAALASRWNVPPFAGKITGEAAPTNRRLFRLHPKPKQEVSVLLPTPEPVRLPEPMAEQPAENVVLVLEAAWSVLTIEHVIETAKQYGISQHKLAKAVGVKRSTIWSAFHRGAKQERIQRLRDGLIALGVPPRTFQT